MQDDKLKELEFSVLGLDNLDYEIKEILTDYDDEGYKLLYLILYYNKAVGTLSFNFDRRTPEEIENNVFTIEHLNVVKNLGDEFVKGVGKRSLEIFDKFYRFIGTTIPSNLDITDNLSKYLKILEGEVLEYLRGLAAPYKFEDLAFVAPVLKTDIVFNVFYPQIKNYFEKEAK